MKVVFRKMLTLMPLIAVGSKFGILHGTDVGPPATLCCLFLLGYVLMGHRNYQHVRRDFLRN